MLHQWETIPSKLSTWQTDNIKLVTHVVSTVNIATTGTEMTMQHRAWSMQAQKRIMSLNLMDQLLPTRWCWLTLHQKREKGNHTPSSSSERRTTISGYYGITQVASRITSLLELAVLLFSHFLHAFSSMVLKHKQLKRPQTTLEHNHFAVIKSKIRIKLHSFDFPYHKNII